MTQRVQRLLKPGIHLFIAVLLLFVVITAFYSWQAALAELVIILALVGYYYSNKSKQQKEVMQYIDGLTVQVDEAAKDTMLNAPLPMMIFRPESGELIWSNDKFLEITQERAHIFDISISSILPDFDVSWLLEGESMCSKEIELANRRFLVFGNLVRGDETGKRSFIATTYWVDITEYSVIRQEYEQARLVVSILCIDNYEELVKGLSEAARTGLLSEIEARLTEWTDQTGGIFIRNNRDDYLFFFEERYLHILIEQRFSVLDSIREVVSPSGIAATLSIGIGCDAQGGFSELYQYANLSLEMALSRGGDQVVVKNRNNLEFYGGRSKETEKRTKVKTRVMANALGELIEDASAVFVMGHAFPDMDAVGASVGICAIARSKGIAYYILEESGNHPSVQLVAQLKAQEPYRDAFITEQKALELLDSRALLVVVDTSRPEQVQSRAVLDSAKRVAVIDHHQRAGTYIANAALNFHEPYASSAAEMVTDLIGHIMEQGELLRCEAEALLSGIVLDTKNFTIRTGGRTFEMAAYLRRAGADTTAVRRLFQNDLQGMIGRYDIIRSAQTYRNGVAVAVSQETVDRVTAAQAADEMLNIGDIEASFVLFPDQDGRIILSGRSAGEINVQTILEKLGGGGNAAAAGAQISGKSLQQVEQELRAAVDNYFDIDA